MKYPIRHPLRNLRLLVPGAALLSGLSLALPAPPARAFLLARDVYTVAITGGGEGREQVSGLTADLRRDYPEGPAALVVLVHGYDTRPAVAKEVYDEVADRLRDQAGEAGRRLAVVGVIWQSDPGPARKWLGQAAAHRVLKGIGIGKARDPYTTIAWRAQGAGRRGLREVLFALRDTFPATPLHVVAHSLGARVALHALAPDLAGDEVDGGRAFAPERELKIESMILAGADLDARLFVRGERAERARAALERVGLWWFTVPEPGQRDRALQIRRWHTGQPAMGAQGPIFRRDDAARLLREGRLVLDVGEIPRNHQFVNYFRDGRATAVAAALERSVLARANGTQAVAGRREELGPEAEGSPVAQRAGLLERVEAARAAQPTLEALAPYLNDTSVAVQVYAAWRLEQDQAGSRGMLDGEFTVKGALEAIREARQRGESARQAGSGEDGAR